jgi:hypothetical protein
MTDKKCLSIIWKDTLNILKISQQKLNENVINS